MTRAVHLMKQTTSFYNIVFSSCLEFRTMDKVQNPRDSECYITLPVPFRYNSNYTYFEDVIGQLIVNN
jgi:hypothetical protein